MSSTFINGNSFYPNLLENAGSRALVRAWTDFTGLDPEARLTIDFGMDSKNTFRTKYVSAIADFRDAPHKLLTISEYLGARNVARGIANPSSSSSSSASPADVPKLRNVSKSVYESWTSSSDGRINPEMLKYIRDTADHFEGIALSAVTYSNVRSASLAHRKMMTYLIEQAGSVDMAVRWVDEKILHPEDPVATSAIIAIPRSKIELILSEHAIIHKEGAFHEFLRAAFDADCVYYSTLEDKAPEFIGGGSKEELSRGVKVDPEMRHARRVAFARANCNYLRSLFTSRFFRDIIARG